MIWHQIPSTLVTLDGLLIFWLAGNQDPRAWSVGLFGEVLWVAYSLWSHQYGFLIGAVFFTIVYARNLRKARKLISNGAVGP